MNVTIGIDPGLDGGIACIREPAGGDLEVYARTMPTLPSPKGKGRILDPASTISWFSLYRWSGCQVFIEVQRAMPKQGVVSIFTNGRNYGLLLGLLIGKGMSYTEVQPRAWQTVMLAGMGKDTKAASVYRAQQLFPGVLLLATPKCKKFHDGMADALLIAEFGRRSLQGEPR